MVAWRENDKQLRGVQMADAGGVFKRCGCIDRATGRRSGDHCPRLTEQGHGSWYFACSTRSLLGQVERVRRGGPTQAAALHARDELLEMSREERVGRNWTVTKWLRYWLSTRTRIRATTKMHYIQDIERFLIPHIGTLTLAQLSARQLTAVFAKFGLPHSVCTSARPCGPRSTPRSAKA